MTSLPRPAPALAEILAGPTRVPRLAQAVLAFVLVGFGAAALITGLQAKLPSARLVMMLVALPAVLVIQVVFFGGQHYRGRPRATLLALLVQVVLVWGLMPFIGQAWLGQVGFLVGSLLLATTARVAVPVTLLMLVPAAGIVWSETGSWLSTLYAVNATLVTGFVVFGLTTLARFVVELHDAREELASLAVAAERDRVARDLHDLMGFSLSAITLKSDLAGALVVDQPQRARDELTELGLISRQALKDVRRVAHGGADGRSLVQEVASATSILGAAGISVEVHQDDMASAGIIDSDLVAVLREAVTNVLRHSRATRCILSVRISSSTIALSVDNDGVVDPAASSGHRGLRNMQERTAGRGGSWRAAPDGTWFRLAVTLPRSTSALPPI